jgi:hypothetical protein
MKPVIGVYLGWIAPESKKWEPMYRTIRCPGGYQSERTQLYTPTLERYPGLELSLKFHPNPLKLPFALEIRTPLVREDYEWYSRLLDLPYPNMDVFEFVGRTGGLMVGDDFSICPIVDPNDDGVYTYKSLLWKVNKEVYDSLDENTQLQAIARHDRPTLITANGRPLGELSPHFLYLGNEIKNIKVLKISEAHYFIGRLTLISFDTPVNLYATSEFALASKEAIGV